MELYSEKKEKPKLFWKLKNEDADSLLLVICDDTGVTVDCGNILRIDKKTGRVTTCQCVNEELDLVLDEEGRVKVS
jgi:hypothetical protein